jgi:hypothetical protein
MKLSDTASAQIEEMVDEDDSGIIVEYPEAEAA